MAFTTNANVPFGQNPYTGLEAGAIQQLSNLNLQQNVMPGVRSGARAAGQYGGSRQGIAEGVAAGNAQVGVNGAVSNLLSDAYRADQNFYLGNQGQMQNFYTQQRGLDQSGMQLGANLYGVGNAGNLGIGAGQTALGNQYMGSPAQSLSAFSGLIGPYSGLNTSQATSFSNTGSNNTATTGNTSQQQGGGAMGAIGGGMFGLGMGRNYANGQNNYGATNLGMGGTGYTGTNWGGF